MGIIIKSCVGSNLRAVKNSDKWPVFISIAMEDRIKFNNQPILFLKKFTATIASTGIKNDKPNVRTIEIGICPVAPGFTISIP
jgi:hypothetical protein